MRLQPAHEERHDQQNNQRDLESNSPGQCLDRSFAGAWILDQEHAAQDEGDDNGQQQADDQDFDQHVTWKAMSEEDMVARTARRQHIAQ